MSPPVRRAQRSYGKGVITKVLTREPGPEAGCNHARGTLVELTAGADPAWDGVAALYPGSGHDYLSNDLGASLGIPADLFGLGLPVGDLDAPPAGEPTDRYLAAP